MDETVDELESKLVDLARRWYQASHERSRVQNEYILVVQDLWDRGWRGDGLEPEDELPEKSMPYYYTEYWRQQAQKSAPPGDGATTVSRSPLEVAMAVIRAMEDVDLEALRATVHLDAARPSMLNSEPPYWRERGPVGFYECAQRLHQFSADITWDVHEAIADRDLVAVQSTLEGTQTGEYVTYGFTGAVAEVFPNHGLAFSLRQSEWFRMRDGLVVGYRADHEFGALRARLGW